MATKHEVAASIDRSMSKLHLVAFDLVVALNAPVEDADDEVAVLADLLGAGGDLGEDGVGSSLIHLALGNTAVQALGDLILAVCGKMP